MESPTAPRQETGGSWSRVKPSRIPRENMSDPVEFKNLIGGKLRPAASGRLLDSINPATGEVWARIPASDQNDANAAVSAAVAAFPEWSALPPSARTAYLKKASQVFIENGEEIARLESTDNGVLHSITRHV